MRISDWSSDVCSSDLRTVDLEYFRVWLVEGLGYADGSKGGRPPFDPVMMFKILILQAQHTLSDARTEYMIRDRLRDRKRVVSGKSVSVRVDLGGGRVLKKKTATTRCM